MFRQRLLTVLCLVPLILFAIYYTNVWLLGTVVLMLVVIGGWEWSQLIPINAVMNKVIFILILLLMVGLSWYWFSVWLNIGLLLWCIILFAVLTFPASQAYWGSRALVGGTCLLLLPLFVNTFIAIYEHSHGADLIVYILCLVWATDIGAYLAGKQWGGHKLIPMVSPGKTVEGAMGGFIFAALVAVVGYFYFNIQAPFTWFLVAFITILISMFGDLFISMLKRRSKIKDTGNIFPGHGGVLDRIDSLLAALPVFYYGLFFIVLGQR